MKSVIVTGATSFIGVHLVNLLLIKGYFVYAVVRPNSNNLLRLRSNPNLKIVPLDLSEIMQLANYVDVSVDCFYHLAWEGVRAHNRDDFGRQQNNYKCAIKAIKIAAKIGCKAFVGAGSQAEYGAVKGIITENCNESPSSMYGKAKLQTFREGFLTSKNVGMRFLWPRIFSVYGPFDFDSTLIMSCISRMQKNESIDLTKCSQLWDFLYVEDAVSALVKLGESEKLEGVYNIASGIALPLRDYVITMKEIFSSQSILNFGEIEVSAERLISIAPSIDKIKTDTDWHPWVSFEEGINKMVNLFDLLRKKYQDVEIQPIRQTFPTFSSKQVICPLLISSD